MPTNGTPNRQPIFTQAPILVSRTFDPPVIIDNFNAEDGNFSTNPYRIYTGQSDEGDLIDRIRISATADSSNADVTAKLVYVYIRWYNVNDPIWSLYKTLAMPARVLNPLTGVTNPELELTFAGGLVINLYDEILIGASTNKATTTLNGDYLSVTIEGGRYTLNP